jgi:putative DNA primase/helicase
VERWLAQRVGPDAEKLRAACSAWAHHNVQAISDAPEPSFPDALGDRACEVWWSLLTIADLVGQDWPQRAREAARALSAGGDVSDEAPEHERLLEDIRNAFGEDGTIFTKTLLHKLGADEEGPWAAKRDGKGLNPYGLASLLRPFGIKSRTVRIGAATAKGFHLEQFDDAFARYLSHSSHSSHSSHPASQRDSDVTDVTDVTAQAGTENGNQAVDFRPRSRCPMNLEEALAEAKEPLVALCLWRHM